MKDKINQIINLFIAIGIFAFVFFIAGIIFIGIQSLFYLARPFFWIFTGVVFLYVIYIIWSNLNNIEQN